MWKYVHRADSRAKVVPAGTGRLYGSGRELGRFGIADPDWRRKLPGNMPGIRGMYGVGGLSTLG